MRPCCCLSRVTLFKGSTPADAMVKNFFPGSRMKISIAP